MKKQFSYILLGLLMVTSLKGQIKIGENPQNLDPASVLELESDSRVLVITRMTTAQMENTTPLRGAVVYNTDTQCVHFHDGALWINLCDRPDEQTFTADAIVNFSPTMIITQDPNGTNFNFEVGEIRGENIVDTSINGEIDIQPGSITGLQLQDASISYEKLAEGNNTGEILWWNGASWTLVNESDLGITEQDGVIGNEVTDATAGGSLTRSGTGAAATPYTLDVVDGGIGSDELATDAVTTDKIAAGAVESADIAADAVNAATINPDVAGSGLAQNGATGALEVNVASLTGDGDISSTDLTVTGGTDAAFTDVTLEIATGVVGNTELATDAVTTDKIAAGAVESADIAADAVNAATINPDVAGSGLAQNGATGALEVNVASLTGDGDISSTDLTVTGGTDAAFTDVTLEIATGVVGNTELATDAVTTDKIEPSATNGQVLTTVLGATTWQNPYHAIGKVNTATAANISGATIAPIIGTGNYQVDFSSNATSANYVIQLTVLNAAANGYSIEVVTQTISDFTVQITDEGGAAVDASWYFTVIDF